MGKNNVKLQLINESFLIKLRKGLITIGLCAGLGAGFTACDQKNEEVPKIEITNEVTPKLEKNIIEQTNEVETITPTVTPTVTPEVTVEEVVEENANLLTKEQVLTRIDELSEKYTDLTYDDIKVIVVGASLDCMDEKVAYEILGVTDESQLEEIANVHTQAILKILCGIYDTIFFKDIEIERQKFDYERVPKLQELFFDEKLIAQGKYFDDMFSMFVNDRENTEEQIGYNCLAYVHNHYLSDYDGYFYGEAFNIDDETVSQSGKGHIDFMVISMSSVFFSSGEYDKEEIKYSEYSDELIKLSGTVCTPFNKKIEEKAKQLTLTK